MEQPVASPSQTLSSDIRPPSSSNKKLIIIGVILLLIVGSGSYFLGAKSQQNKQTLIEVTPTMNLSKAEKPTLTTSQVPDNSPVPTQHLKVNPMANWKTYTNSQYGFSFQYPADWKVNDGQNYIAVADSQKNTLGIGVKKSGESTRIMRTGVGAGDVIEKGSVTFLTIPITRNVVVWQGSDKTVLYKNASEITASNLIFTLSLDNMSGDYNSVSQTAEDTADKIVESFKIYP